MRFLKQSLGLVAAVLLAQPSFALTTIDSLPFRADKAGETYQLSADLSLSSGDAITITADRVVLDGNGRTLRYAESGRGHAIVIDLNASSVVIKNFVIRQGSYDPGSREKISAIYANNNSSGVEIIDNDIEVSHGGRVSGAVGYGIQLDNASSSTRNVIRGNRVYVRGSSGSRGISIEGRWAGSIAENDVTIDDASRSPAGYPRAISLIGTRNVDVTSNFITIGSGIDTGQGISLWRAKEGRFEANTVIMRGIQSRGILLDGDSSDNEVIDNSVSMESTVGGDRYSAGIRIRYGSSNNILRGNIVDATNAGASFPVRLGGADASFPEQPKNNQLISNKFYAGSRTVYIEDGSDFSFLNNEVVAKPGGFAVFLWCKPCTNNEFNYDTIEGRIRATGSASETEFCGTNVGQADVSSSDGSHEFEIRESDCTVSNGVRPQAPRLIGVQVSP